MTAREMVLAFLADSGPAKREDIRQAVHPEMTRQGFWKILNSLKEDGFVTAKGAGPSSRWLLQGPSAVRRHLETPWERRRSADYDISILDSYVPNRTFYISTEIRRALKEAGTPPPGRPGTTDRRVFERFTADLSWASSRLEGNTYSLLETERLLQFGEEAEGRTQEEAAMILNHKRAIGYIRPDPETPAISAMTLRSIHALVSADLLPNPMWEGALRTHEVRIGGSAYAPPNDPHVVVQAFEALAEKAGQIADPFEQAFFLTVHVPLLQAFEDCNKRTSRVAASIPLLAAGLSPLSFLETKHRDYVDGLLGVYEMNDVSLALDVFVESYMATASRYWFPTVQQGAVSSAAIGNRAFIESSVRILVQEHGGFDRAAAEEMCVRQGIEVHLEIVDGIQDAIEGLNAGNLIRFGLSLSDLERLRNQGEKRPPASGGSVGGNRERGSD